MVEPSARVKVSPRVKKEMGKLKKEVKRTSEIKEFIENRHEQAKREEAVSKIEHPSKTCHRYQRHSSKTHERIARQRSLILGVTRLTREDRWDARCQLLTASLTILNFASYQLVPVINLYSSRRMNALIDMWT